LSQPLIRSGNAVELASLAGPRLKRERLADETRRPVAQRRARILADCSDVTSPVVVHGPEEITSRRMFPAHGGQTRDFVEEIFRAEELPETGARCQ